MDVYIKISIRNPEWFANGVQPDYREEWEEINRDKVPEYNEGVSFKIAGGVASYAKDMGGSYAFRFLSESGEEANSVTIRDVDATEFVHPDGRSTWVVVSDSLIHHTMANQNRAGSKRYWYYFLKEDSAAVQFARNIWLSAEHVQFLMEQLPGFDLEGHCGRNL